MPFVYQQGGLGVKNLTLFNKALLSLWKWRFLTDDAAVWSELLRFRCGHLPTQLWAGTALSTAAKYSIWWKDIVSLDRAGNENWFVSHIACRVGNGNNTGFWRFKWYGDQPLCALFPDLFAKETSKEALIVERLQGNGSNRNWTWQWMQQLSESEIQQVAALEELLFGLSLRPDESDRWTWKSGMMGLFSVRSCYSLLLDTRPVQELDENVIGAAKKLWKIDAPSKALIFG
jgi:hypothetical protein